MKQFKKGQSSVIFENGRLFFILKYKILEKYIVLYTKSSDFDLTKDFLNDKIRRLNKTFSEEL